MPKGQPASLLRQLATLLTSGTTAGLTDRQLLDRFQAKRAESTESALAAETAFATLVERHGPMVWGVCQRVLGNVHEAEDAFQATFLVLVRKSETVRVEESLGGWLYGVAHRVALRARAERARRESGPRPSFTLSPPDPAVVAEQSDITSVLGEEIDRLPARYRCAIDLCCLQGMTLDQASRQLDWPVATVKSRLARGRVRLRERLVRRGIAPASAVVVSALSGKARAAVPPELVLSTVGVARSGGSHAVTHLTEGVLRMMIGERIKRIAAGALLGIGLTTGTLAQQSARDPGSPPEPRAVLAQAPTAARAAAEPDRKWTRSLPNGATIEVLGVSTHPSGEGTWWRPDGTPLPQPPCDRSGTILSANPGDLTRAIAVRLTGVPAAADRHWWINEASGGSQEQAKLEGKPVPGLSVTVTEFPRGTQVGTVRFEVASGPWKTVQTWGTSPGARGVKDGPSFIFGEPIATRKGTALSVTHSIPDVPVRLVAVDNGGREHPAELRSGSGVWSFRQLVGEFDLPPEQIAQFLVQTRPYERVEIPQVALQPSRPR